jgi:VWFA-related protein
MRFAAKAGLALLVAAGVAAASAPPSAPPDLAAILEKAAQYVVEYEQALHDVAAEEIYTQRTGPQQKMGGGIALLCTPAGCQRTTRADVVFVRLRGEVPWGTFRDVFEVDGQKVRDREPRLEPLFGASSPASGAERVQAILKESARYNIGPAVRNINFPTMALAFLLPQNQQRFAWRRGGTRRFTTVKGVEVHFEETARPTMVDDGARGGLPAKGRFWIDAARGTVLRSETTFRFEPDRAWAYVATQYRPEPKLAMWVPAEMRETYQDLRGTPIFGSPSEATARYSSFRRFTVTIEDVSARLGDEPAATPQQQAPAPAEPPAQQRLAEPAHRSGPVTERPAGPLRPLPNQEPAAGPPPTQAPPSFPSAVELITVDAVVLDKDGQAVPGLTKDDFVVKEDGEPRQVVSFEAFDVRAPREEEAPAATAAVASNERTASDLGRAFAIVVDDLGIAPERTQETRATVKAFLERSARDGDLVALGTTSGDAWWSARVPEGREDLLAVLARARGRLLDAAVLDRMSDYEAFWIANHQQSLFDFDVASETSILARVVRRWEKTGACPALLQPQSRRSCAAKVQGRAVDLDAARRYRLLATLGCVRRAVEAVAAVRGRKSLLLLSEGFLEDFGGDARGVAALSREANAAVYFVDVHGLQALPGGLGSAADAGPPTTGSERFEAAVLGSSGAVALADETGGFSVRNTNDLAAGAGHAAAESRVFYLLGFQPPEGKAPGEWRKLRVEVKRPGLTVRARRGYTLRSEMSTAAAKPGKEKKERPALDPVVARAIDSPGLASGIPLRAVAYVLEPRPKDSVHVLVAAEVDAGTSTDGAPQPRHLEVSTVALLRDTGRGFRHEDTITVSAPRDDEPRWREFIREFELPPGVAQIRVVVRDPATGAIGSVAQRIEVPAANEFRLSTPILTDRVEPATAPGELPRPALAAHRLFAGAGLYCRYEVFGAARPGGALPRVSSAFQLRSEDGSVVQEASATPIAPDRDGHLVRMVGASLEKLEPGPYELVLEVRDERSGETLVRKEPLVLARAAN